MNNCNSTVVSVVFQQTRNMADVSLPCMTLKDVVEKDVVAVILCCKLSRLFDLNDVASNKMLTGLNVITYKL